jgi:lysozyme
LTIGYGHLITQSEQINGYIEVHSKRIKWKDGITEAEAEQILLKDVSIAEGAVRELVKTPLAQHQFDALVSWTFNLGVENLKSSTLLKRINMVYVPKEFMKWVHCNGKKLQGLVNRRKDEVLMWQGRK